MEAQLNHLFWVKNKSKYYARICRKDEHGRQGKMGEEYRIRSIEFSGEMGLVNVDK